MKAFRLSPVHIAIALLLSTAAATLGCSKSQPAPGSPETANTQPAAASVQPVSSSNASAVSAAGNVPAPKVNGNHAMQYAKEVVAFGSRPPGSPAHVKLEQYILSKLHGVDVVQDRFSAQTPDGRFPINNIIAKFPGKKEGVIVIAGHYDTLYSQPKFVGANDGGSSTALLLAIADELRDRPNDGYSIWLVWTDGEEAFATWTDTDSLYGTRELAQKWQQDGTAKQIKALIVVDMIGDADLDILKDLNSTPWLTDLVYTAATNLGYQSHFYKWQTGMDDDHMPFLKAGIPSVDLIDFTYGYNNVFWHTPEDTVDKLSPLSLAITGDVVLETVRLINAR